MPTSAPASPPRAAPMPAATSTLVEQFRRQLRERPDRPSLLLRAGGRWAPVTWRQFGDASRRLGAWLVEEGIAEQGHVAIWSGNRPEWHVADMAVLSARCRPVPVYLTVSAEQAAYILDHSQSELAVVEGPDVLGRLLSVRDRLPRLRRVVVLDAAQAVSEDGLVISWQEALRRGQEALDARSSELERRAVSVASEDVATLIYTSGTTGPPKAVMLTHANVIAGVRAIMSLEPAYDDDRVLSYLPLAHIAERLASEFRSYVIGNPTWFSAIDRLGEDLREVRPTTFFGVPRVWEKMAARIRGELERQPPSRRRVGRWAIATGERVADLRQAGRQVPPRLAASHALAERLVLARVRQAIGLDQARVVASGAAPIAPEVLRFFLALGLEICEVYGLSETTGATTFNRPGHARFGTVGPALPGIELRIAADGEILVRGATVFAGYLHDPAATAAVLSEDGWFATGDVGEIDADGSLRITDRKKDLIITAGGKNISPSNIETALKNHPLVANAVVIGDRRPYLTALLTVDAAEVAALGLDAGAQRTRLEAHVTAVNATLAHVEQVRRWTILDHDFTVGEELTPTMKVRRAVVAERYAAEIEDLYRATASSQSGDAASGASSVAATAE
ncbi:MAG TPA: long-chain fatty acid--CoA ligase [Candidatus Dormibacteraeota bacterium]|nr:long-chain fatty acid--CoA ligase [Candidatus Dormibacteraeota bacterium]